jgi:hypothetical protein
MGAAISLQKNKKQTTRVNTVRQAAGGASSSLMDQISGSTWTRDRKCGREEMGSTFDFFKFASYFYSQRAF